MNKIKKLIRTYFVAYFLHTNSSGDQKWEEGNSHWEEFWEIDYEIKMYIRPEGKYKIIKRNVYYEDETVAESNIESEIVLNKLKMKEKRKLEEEKRW